MGKADLVWECDYSPRQRVEAGKIIWSIASAAASASPREPMTEISTVERAFNIARSGKVRTISELRKVLRDEGHAAALQHTDGPSIQKQLRAAMAQALSGLGSD